MKKDYSSMENIVYDILKEKGATEALHKVEEFISTEGNLDILSQLLVLKARIEILYLQDVESGLESLSKALNLAEEIGDRVLKARIFNSAAGIMLFMGDSHNALQFYRKALENMKEGEYDYLRVLNNIGETYKRMLRLDRALEYFTLTQNIAEKYGVKRVLAYALENTGEIHAIKGNWEEAKKWIEKAYSVAREIDEMRLIRYVELIYSVVNGDIEKIEKLEKEMKENGEFHEIADAYYYFHRFAPPEIREKLLNKAAIIFAEIKDGSMHNAAVKKLTEIKNLK